MATEVRVTIRIQEHYEVIEVEKEYLAANGVPETIKELTKIVAAKATAAFEARPSSG